MELSRYAVPLRDLEAVHVQVTDQVALQAEAAPPAPRWDGVIGDDPRGGGGGGGDADGE